MKIYFSVFWGIGPKINVPSLDGHELLQCLFETHYGQADKAGGQQDLGRDGRPEFHRPHAADGDALEVLQEPAHRIDEGEDLDRFGHVADGEDESAEQHGGHNDQEGGQQGLLLGAGADADQQGDAQVADEVEGRQ